jgi:hypothetical protein
MNGHLDYRVRHSDSDPVILVPIVDFDKLDDPSIIDAF